MYKVHSNVPLPAPARRASGRRKYPFEDLEVGDYFFVPHRPRERMSTYVSTVSKQMGRKFSARQVTMALIKGTWQLVDASHPEGVSGTGIWRVS